MKFRELTDNKLSPEDKNEQSLTIQDMPIAVVSMLSTIQQYHMLDDAHKLGIALSGGADSLALLEGIAFLINYNYLTSIEIIPIYINQYMDSQKEEKLKNYVLSRYGLALQVFTIDTRPVATSLIQRGKAPCRGCAPLRAKVLAKASSHLYLDALALGHHLNDIMATLLMNVFHRGKFETMQPVAFRKHNKQVPIVRPFYFTEEKHVKDVCPAGASGLFDCGMCTLHATERARAMAYVEETFRIHSTSPHFAQESLQSLIQMESVSLANIQDLE